MRRFLALLGLLALLWAANGARAAELVDWRESQRGYGAFVASLSAGGTGKRGTDASAHAPLSLVLVKTDGLAVDFDALDAVYCVAGPGNRFTLAFTASEDADAAVAALQDDPRVIYAEADGEVRACETAAVDDIAFNSYGAASMGFQPLLTWARRCGGETRVAVVDSGVYPHALLADRLETGWDFVDGDDDPTNDGFGHGTHVAGIIADCTRGVSVRLYALRVLDDRGGGQASNAANAILEAVEQGIPVINLSFVSTMASAALDDAVLSAVESGCAVVMAAGNNAIDTSQVWPAHLEEAGVIVVGACAASGQRASFSNYGASVDLYAYGSSVLSCGTGGGLTTKSGTSQATPHIAAACALLNLVRGGLSPAEAEAALKGVLAGPTGEIPMLDRLTPQRVECRLSALALGLGERLPLPTRALPASCGASIEWSTDDEAVAHVDESGALVGVAVGATVLTGKCTNFNDLRVDVTVSEAAPEALRLPLALASLEPEALSGVAASRLIAGEALTRIDDGAIDPGILILCPPGSFTAEYAEVNGLSYIATME